MTNTRFMKIERDEVVTSQSRTARPVLIPPINFPGELEVVTTGVWHPPEPIELTAGWCTAKEPGSALAGFAIMKLNPSPWNNSEVIKAFTLPAASKLTVFTMGKHLAPAIIYPSDAIYVISFRSTGHLNTTINFHAVSLEETR